MRFFVAALPGVEELLAKEIAGLIGSEPTVVPGGVEVEGSDDTLYRIALGAGLGSHIMLRVGSFRARRFEVLLRETRELPWRDILPKGASVAVRAKCRKSRLHHSGAVEERVLRGIAEARQGKSN